MITWEYLAGFFDGEGCITRPGIAPSSVPVQITQKDPKILREIQSFLSHEGIQRVIVSAYDKRRERNIWHIFMIGNRKGSIRFLSSIFPYLKVKRTIAQDALRWMKMCPPLPRTRGREYRWQAE